MNGFVVAAIGISVVFLALVLIFVTLTIFDRVDVWLTERNKANELAPTHIVQAAPKPVTQPQPRPVVEEGISAEVVAAISAAVMGAFDQPVRVKSIRYRRQSVRHEWQLQGRASHITSHNPVKRKHH